MAKCSTAFICVLFITTLSTNVTYAQQPARAWVEVNYLSAQPHDERPFTSFPEAQAGFRMSLLQDLSAMPRANGFDIGGGYTVWAGLGVGLRWLRARSDRFDVAATVFQAGPSFGSASD